MRRAIPLAKLVLWMIVSCAILSALLGLLARSRGTIPEVQRTANPTIPKPIIKVTQPLAARRRSRASRAGAKLGLKVSADM